MRHRPSSALLALLLTASQTLAHPQGPPGPPGHGHGGPPPNLDTTYENTVCHPMTDYAPNPVPPCMEIETIETICTPNGTSPLALKAHQQCMCEGSYFTEWPFCLKCLFFHGLRSQRDVVFYHDVLSTASSTFCGAHTPTAEFKMVFSSMQGSLPSPTTGETIKTDQAVDQTAVSLYYTASGSQGPGRITGEATAATATGLLTAPGPMRTSLGGESKSETENVGAGTSVVVATTTGGGSTAAGATQTAAVNSNGTVRVRRTRSGSVMAAVVAVAAGVLVCG